MLLTLAAMLPSCGFQKVKVVEVPVIPKPALPAEPAAPSLASPTVIVITSEDAEYYSEVCDRYQAGDSNEQDIAAETGLTRGASCDWAIYGHTVQDEITFEDTLNQMADYAERLRAYARFLRQTIVNLTEER